MTVVTASDDDVAGTGSGAITEVYSVGFNLSVVDAVEAGSGVERGYFCAAAGDEQAGVPGSGVDRPGVVCDFAHGLVRTVVDSVVVEVVVKGFGSPVAEAQGGGGFVGVGEAVQVGELDSADVMSQEPQRAAGLDRGELGRVTEKADHGAAFSGAWSG